MTYEEAQERYNDNIHLIGCLHEGRPITHMLVISIPVDQGLVSTIVRLYIQDKFQASRHMIDYDVLILFDLKRSLSQQSLPDWMLLSDYLKAKE